MVARGEIARFWSLESLHMGMCAQNELLCRGNVAASTLFPSKLLCSLFAAARQCKRVCESSFILVQRPEGTFSCGYSKSKKLALFVA